MLRIVNQCFCLTFNIWPILIHIPRSLVWVLGQYLAWSHVLTILDESNFIIVNFKVPIVWIHDYHLMLAANEIREMAEEEKLDCKIGFFLHIPFPPWDIFKIFPWVDSILQGILRLVKPFFQ